MASEREEAEDRAGIQSKVLEYIHFVLKGTNEVDGDLCNSVQLAADGIAGKLASASLTIAALRTACQHVIDWRGFDGDGITDPVREKIVEALAITIPADSLVQEVVTVLSDARGMAHRHYIYDECQDCGMLRGSIDALLAQIGGKT